MTGHEDDADTIDLNPALPSFTVEDEPTIVFGDRAPKHPSSEGAPSEGAPSSRNGYREDDPAFTNVFLNVGRRDGLRTEDVQRLLVEKANLRGDDVGHIRVRDRITFVGIRKEHAEAAIQSLIGAAIGGRTLNAELARASK